VKNAVSISLTRFAKRKTSLALILVSLASLGMVAIEPVWASGDVWEAKAPMQVARSGVGVAVRNEKYTR